MKQIILTMLLVSVPLLGQAADFNAAPKSSTDDLGAEFTTAFSRTVNGRLGINAFDYEIIERTDISEPLLNSLDFDLDAWSALIDWHPFRGGFRVSGGLLHRDQNIERLTNDPYSGLALGNALNGKEFGTLNSILDFDGTSPYLGVGWGNALSRNGRLGLVVDVGVVLQDDSVGLFGFDLNSPSSTLAEDEDYLPVFSLGLSYQFN